MGVWRCPKVTQLIRATQEPIRNESPCQQTDFRLYTKIPEKRIQCPTAKECAQVMLTCLNPHENPKRMKQSTF